MFLRSSLEIQQARRSLKHTAKPKVPETCRATWARMSGQTHTSLCTAHEGLMEARREAACGGGWLCL